MRRVSAAMAVAGLVVALGAAPASAGGGNVKKFCKTLLAIDKAFTDEDVDADELLELFEALPETAPPEIADAVDVIVPAFQEDPEGAFADPAVNEANVEIEEFRATGCGYEEIDVTLQDYAFEGVPDEIEKGTVAFTLTNEGTEFHEFVVVRLKGDATVDDLLDAEGDEEEVATLVGQNVDDAVAGETRYAFVTFKKTGRYAVVCFYPVGSTDEEAFEEADEAGAPTHASEGMVTEFEVT